MTGVLFVVSLLLTCASFGLAYELLELNISNPQNYPLIEIWVGMIGLMIVTILCWIQFFRRIGRW